MAAKAEVSGMRWKYECCCDFVQSTCCLPSGRRQAQGACAAVRALLCLHPALPLRAMYATCRCAGRHVERLPRARRTFFDPRHCIGWLMFAFRSSLLLPKDLYCPKHNSRQRQLSEIWIIEPNSAIDCRRHTHLHYNFHGNVLNAPLPMYQPR